MVSQRKIIRFVFIVVCAGLLATIMVDSLRVDQNDTDGENERSGLQLYFDHGTGCQYVGTPEGGLTPRMDHRGEHVCRG